MKRSLLGLTRKHTPASFLCYQLFSDTSTPLNFSSMEVKIKKIKAAGALNLSPCSSVQQCLWHSLGRNHYQPHQWNAKFLQCTVLEQRHLLPSLSLEGSFSQDAQKAFWSVGYITILKVLFASFASIYFGSSSCSLNRCLLSIDLAIALAAAAVLTGSVFYQGWADKRIRWRRATWLGDGQTEKRSEESSVNLVFAETIKIIIIKKITAKRQRWKEEKGTLVQADKYIKMQHAPQWHFLGVDDHGQVLSQGQGRGV